ncbi:MAG: hypothetical protein H0T73_07595, partial [Ardenticatenales bacterium]|nr:hypothetical protein [Ardenticatenales bacterium]
LKMEQGPFVVAAERLYLNLSGVVRHPFGRRVLRGFLRLGEPGTHQVMEALWDDPRLAPSANGWKLGTARRMAGVVGLFLRRLVATLWQPQRAQARIQQVEALLDTFQTQAARTTTLAERMVLLEAMCVAIPTIIAPLFLPTIASGVFPLRVIDALAAGLPDGTRLTLEITRGLPNNVTTEMDLALWEVARTIQKDAASAARFVQLTAAELSHAYLAGELPERSQQVLRDFLRHYGMRGLAEIDFGRARWREDPTPLMQVLQSYISIEDEQQAPDRVFRRGAESAEAAIEQIATTLGPPKAGLVRWLARRVRQLAGLRESPKFSVIRLFGIVRESLLQGARELVAQGLLSQPEDIFFLRLRELRAIATTAFPSDYRTARAHWPDLVAERRARYEREKQRRQVPRVLLSDGQSFYEGMRALGGEEEGVLVGSPVSPGVVEGTVHVVHDPYQIQLVPGEILVCHGTDPAWTPLFLAAGGLIMEVGGLMTHGSVVARERWYSRRGGCPRGDHPPDKRAARASGWFYGAGNDSGIGQRDDDQ